MGIFVYYHITLLNNWEDIVREQINKIIFSGLYDILEKVKCYAIDPDGNKETCRAYLESMGNKFSLEDVSNDGDEWFTLKHLQYVSDDDKVLYLHTKGVTRYNTSTYNLNENNFTVPKMYNNIADWRNLMEFFLIKKFKTCLFILDKGIHTLGINYVTNPKHYSGNFWWANGNYLRSLNYEKPNNENWILENNDNVYSLFQSPFIGYGHYFASFPLGMVTDIPNENMVVYVSK